MPTYSGLFNGFYTDGSTLTGTGVPANLVFNNDEYGDTIKNKFGKLGKGRSGRVFNAIISALTGAAPGLPITVADRRVASAPQFTFGNGGTVPLETKSYINRNSTATDLTAIDYAAIMAFYPNPYPPDLSGNGGGGHIRGIGSI